ncbi:MAG: hypothetical protein AB7O62_24910 [Pirellulales bacterium]
MVIENPIPPFLEWLLPALATWGIVVGALATVVALAAFVIITVGHGPGVAVRRILGAVGEGLEDLVRISPRRVYALAWLSFAETMRRRVWVAVVVYLVILGFAAWFLKPGNKLEPSHVYLDFLLTATTYLVLWMSLFISVFSLPNDITKKTIFTLATKPVRTSEIILRRILGFTAIGTCLLAVMGLMSYVFVVRQLYHTHEITAADVVSRGTGQAAQGETSLEMGHRHTFAVDEEGVGFTDPVNGHSHEITTEVRDGKTEYTVLGPGALNAKVPIYGALRFRDQAGGAAAHADNVGDEWSYREFIEGGTQAAAIWLFTGLTEDRFPDGLTFNMTLEIFRTYKGDVTKRIPGELVLRNPKTGYELVAAVFTPVEAPRTHSETVPRILTEQGSVTRSVDLFKELVDEGNLEVHIRCIPRQQYYGVGQADLYIVDQPNTFEFNLVKGHLGIWMQMMLVCTIGVMFSTFLNGPVSMLAAAAMLVGGYAIPFMRDLLTGEQIGGGPAESIVRIIQHKDMMTELEPGLYRSVIQAFDAIFQGVLFVVSNIMINLPALSDVSWVSSGFDIPINNLLVHMFTAAGYFVPLYLIGHFILRKRELAK